METYFYQIEDIYLSYTYTMEEKKLVKQFSKWIMLQKQYTFEVNGQTFHESKKFFHETLHVGEASVVHTAQKCGHFKRSDRCCMHTHHNIT